MKASGATPRATGRGRQVEEERPAPGSPVRAAAPNSLPDTDDASSPNGRREGVGPSLTGPLRLSDPRTDEAVQRVAVQAFLLGRDMGRREGIRLAANQLASALQGFDTEGAE